MIRNADSIVTPKWGISAAAEAANRPAKIARPPPVGMGTLLILRGFGTSTKPIFRAKRRANGVKPAVTVAAMANTIKNWTIFMAAPLHGSRLPSQFQPHSSALQQVHRDNCLERLPFPH